MDLNLISQGKLIIDSMNTFGTLFRITSFGESHGKALGVVIDGCPPGLELSEKDLQCELDRRRPGQSAVTTSRQESDTCEILSGIFEGRTTGMPIAVVIFNQDQRSADYAKIKDVFRPSHADLSYEQKYGIRDYRGGGRSSARETVARVIGGAVARKILTQKFGTKIFGFTAGVGDSLSKKCVQNFIEKNPLRMADPDIFPKALKLVEKAQSEGDSLGGIVEIRAQNVPTGLGSPVFGKLEADLARAMMSVGAMKGFEMGEGFSLSRKSGSEANDPFVLSSDSSAAAGRIQTERNVNGGILGGISTGEDIWFRVAVKPTSSIAKPQKTVDSSGHEVDLQIQGRHDPILVPRAVPILEAMTALVLLDHAMMDHAQCHFLEESRSKK